MGSVYYRGIDVSEDFKEFVTILLGAVMLAIAVMACVLAGRATYLLFNLDSVCKPIALESHEGGNE